MIAASRGFKSAAIPECKNRNRWAEPIRTVFFRQSHFGSCAPRIRWSARASRCIARAIHVGRGPKFTRSGANQRLIGFAEPNRAL